MPHERRDSHDLATHEYIVSGVEVRDELGGGELLVRYDATGGGEFERQLSDEEEVDVDVVHGEVDGDEPRPLTYPEPLLQLGDDLLGILLQVVQILHIAGPRVRSQLAREGGHVVGRTVHPSEILASYLQYCIQ